MARVFPLEQATNLGLPGRNALEIVSGTKGARGVTLRLVEIAVPQPGDQPRSPHFHSNFEECIFVLSGQGTTISDRGEYPLLAGDTIVIAPGEKHFTRNTGTVPLVLLCFFPVPDITLTTTEPGVAQPRPES